MIRTLTLSVWRPQICNTHVTQFTFPLYRVIIDRNDASDDPVEYSCDKGCLMAISITFGSTMRGLTILIIGQLIYILKRLKGTDVCV